MRRSFEFALSFLPHKNTIVTTPTGEKYEGKQFAGQDRFTLIIQNELWLKNEISISPSPSRDLFKSVNPEIKSYIPEKQYIPARDIPGFLMDRLWPVCTIKIMVSIVKCISNFGESIIGCLRSFNSSSGRNDGKSANESHEGHPPGENTHPNKRPGKGQKYFNYSLRWQMALF